MEPVDLMPSVTSFFVNIYYIFIALIFIFETTKLGSWSIRGFKSFIKLCVILAFLIFMFRIFNNDDFGFAIPNLFTVVIITIVGLSLLFSRWTEKVLFNRWVAEFGDHFDSQEEAISSYLEKRNFEKMVLENEKRLKRKALLEKKEKAMREKWSVKVSKCKRDAQKKDIDNV